MPDYTAQSTRCTALTHRGNFCDYESLPDAPFPICIKHASLLLRYLNSHMPAPDDMTGRIILSARAFEQASKGPVQRAKPDDAKLPPPPTAVIYYLQVGKLVKIGYTANLMQRMDNYPPDSKLLAVEPGGKGLERQRHGQFHHALGRAREWFTPDDELLGHIARVARQHDIRDYYEPRKRKPSMAVDAEGREIA
jgi:hypothetical protein